MGRKFREFLNSKKMLFFPIPEIKFQRKNWPFRFGKFNSREKIEFLSYPTKKFKTKVEPIQICWKDQNTGSEKEKKSLKYISTEMVNMLSSGGIHFTHFPVICADRSTDIYCTYFTQQLVTGHRISGQISGILFNIGHSWGGIMEQERITLVTVGRRRVAVITIGW